MDVGGVAAAAFEAAVKLTSLDQHSKSVQSQSKIGFFLTFFPSSVLIKTFHFAFLLEFLEYFAIFVAQNPVNPHTNKTLALRLSSFLTTQLYLNI